MKLSSQIHNFVWFLGSDWMDRHKISGSIEGKLCMHFWSFKHHRCWQREVIFSQISHFVISDRIIMSDYPFSFQPKPRLWVYETICRAHNNGIQHVNMSVEHGAHHFTWFLDVLRAFVSVSELIFKKMLNILMPYRLMNHRNFIILML